MIKTIPLVNVKLILEKFPNYHVPSKKKLDQIKIGDRVSISTGRESIQVLIREKNNFFLGESLFDQLEAPIKKGDLIRFKLDNIINILPEK